MAFVTPLNLREFTHVPDGVVPEYLDPVDVVYASRQTIRSD